MFKTRPDADNRTDPGQVLRTGQPDVPFIPVKYRVNIRNQPGSGPSFKLGVNKSWFIF